MRIIVFRHGIAEHWSEDGSDSARKLTEQGVERTKAAAQGLAFVGPPPTRILTSPKRRALETAQIAGAVFDIQPEVEDVLATGSPSQVIAALSGLEDAAVMIVGHEPTLSQVIGRLIEGGGPSGDYMLKKAGAALVEADPSPAGVGRGGFLHWSLPPRVLRALASDA